ncbi:MAG: phosphoenolpyruvate carboxykinase (ATP) [Bacteroidetes bacterium]|nr:phosphoenolpyruvate carboxykinase (ATP) [Fibrella sp.]
MVAEASPSPRTVITTPGEKALKFLGINDVHELNFQLSPAQLVQQALLRREGQLTDTGALMCATGTFTGRSPKDRYIVRDELTDPRVDWGGVNIPFDEARFDRLHRKMCHFVEYQSVYVRYAMAGADPRYQLKLCILTTSAWQNLFCSNMFLRPSDEELADFEPDFTILAVPEFMAHPDEDGTRGANFTMLNLAKRVILIGGTGYAGEIKKGVFSALNFLLPQQRVLPMHCSANVGVELTTGTPDVALFFGLSGTGKTTLSADPERGLIGDDEHGWSDEGVFNFEGGCYAKVIDLTREREPQIFDAIRYGAIVENTRFVRNTHAVNYADTSLTENTRTSYPIDFISNAVVPSVGTHPRHIFFLTCDAFGVLPPIARLTTEQAMDYFVLGYTAKVAGTEMGVTEPQATFSACFGAAFMPLHPTEYARMLGARIRQHTVSVWLVNTGWTGGSYGTGQRMKLPYTRAMIRAALTGGYAESSFVDHPVFGLAMPTACPGVPAELLNPRQTWADPVAYDAKAEHLNALFTDKRDSFTQPTVAA